MDLYIENKFASFDQLSTKHGLTNAHFFRQLQIRDFVLKKFVSFPNLPPLSSLDSLLEVNLLNGGSLNDLCTDNEHIESLCFSYKRRMD